MFKHRLFMMFVNALEESLAEAAQRALELGDYQAVGFELFQAIGRDYPVKVPAPAPYALGSLDGATQLKWEMMFVSDPKGWYPHLRMDLHRLDQTDTPVAVYEYLCLRGRVRVLAQVEDCAYFVNPESSSTLLQNLATGEVVAEAEQLKYSFRFLPDQELCKCRPGASTEPVWYGRRRSPFVKFSHPDRPIQHVGIRGEHQTLTEYTITLLPDAPRTRYHALLLMPTVKILGFNPHFRERY
jgi:hypothetical protein